jgi:threonine dehydrogenase-like Zn-dependent dehydrogenase
LSPDELALVEPQSIGAHGIARADIRQDEFVLIVGAGPIGLGAIEFARLAGARVIVMDTNEHRLSLCHKMGIPHVVDAGSPNVPEQLEEITHGDMPTVVIDATGSRSAINGAFRYMAHGGRYLLIGLQRENIEFNHPEFHKREGTLMSSRNATRADFDHVIGSMKKGLVNPMRYVTDIEKFSEVKNHFPLWLDSRSQAIKVLIELD